jgi:hypothetical protein
MNIKVGTKLKAIKSNIFKECITINKIYTINEIRYDPSTKKLMSFYFNCDKTTSSSSKHPAHLIDLIGENAYLQIVVPKLNSKIKVL